MDIEDIQQVCTEFPGTTEDIKWEDHLAFCVCNKIYFILSLDQVPTPASFKVDMEDFEEITTREGINQAAYFAKGQWVNIDDISRLSASEWRQYIGKSYELVVNKLPKKIQLALKDKEA